MTEARPGDVNWVSSRPLSLAQDQDQIGVFATTRPRSMTKTPISNLLYVKDAGREKPMRKWRVGTEASGSIDR
jgi:hypothetical protein